MAVSKIPRTVFSLVQPSVHALASRLFILSAGRAGSSKYRPTVASFFETSLVTSLYEHLLMSPILGHLEIRHEMPYRGPVGRPKQVDLWLRPPNGGYPHLIEAGDFAVGKVHQDARKMQALNPNGSNWFLAFFRDQEELAIREPSVTIERSFLRANGLDAGLVRSDSHLTIAFEVYRPTGDHERIGASLFRVLPPPPAGAPAAQAVP